MPQYPYVKDYKECANQKEMQASALRDCRAFLNKDKFDQITRAYRDLPMKLEYSQFSFQMAFLVGIEGYPVTVWYDYIYGTFNEAKGLWEGEAHG